MSATSLAFRALCVAGALAALSVPALAQSRTDAAGPANDEIVVPGTRQLREIVRDFVGDITEPGKGGQVARFDRKVCPGVVGARANVAQALIDRIAARAMGVGLTIGEPGCRANILVLVTPDAQRFTPDFVRQNHTLFGVWQDGQTRGAEALEAFQKTARPVRWWHVTQSVTDRGEVLPPSNPTGGDGFDGVPVANVTNSGRLRSGIRQDFNRVIIVVDATQSAAAPFTALADYIAMVSLAQIDPNANVNDAPTILNLFGEIAKGSRPHNGMTDWDVSYLEGLYGAQRFAKSGSLQESQITGDMTRALVAEPKADETQEPAPTTPRPQ